MFHVKPNRNDMKVPDYVNAKLVDQNGMMSDVWRNTINELLTELQSNFSNEGLVPPTQNTANINVINPEATNGTLIYDEDTNELKVRLSDGNFHVIQTV